MATIIQILGEFVGQVLAQLNWASVIPQILHGVQAADVTTLVDAQADSAIQQQGVDALREWDKAH